MSTPAWQPAAWLPPPFGVFTRADWQSLTSLVSLLEASRFLHGPGRSSHLCHVGDCLLFVQGCRRLLCLVPATPASVHYDAYTAWNRSPQQRLRCGSPPCECWLSLLCDENSPPVVQAGYWALLITGRRLTTSLLVGSQPADGEESLIEAQTAADLFRDVRLDPFTPPGRPVLDTDVRRLAQLCVDHAAIDGQLPVIELSILADALADALAARGLPEARHIACRGCAGRGSLTAPSGADAVIEVACPACAGSGNSFWQEPYLAHLRSGQKHWIGCWAVGALRHSA